MWRKIPVVVVLALSGAFLLTPLFPGHPPALASGDGSACLRDYDTVWLVTAEYIAKASQSLKMATGRLNASASAVTVDDAGGIIWYSNGGSLHGWTFDGTERVVTKFADAPPAYVVLAADASDGSVWVATEEAISLFDAAGQLVNSTRSPSTRVVGMSSDVVRQSVWVATASSIELLDRAGVAVIGIDSADEITAIDYENRSRLLWVGTRSGLRAYDADGRQVSEIPYATVVSISGTRDRGAWAATDTVLVRVNVDGEIVSELKPDITGQHFVGIEANPITGGATAISPTRVVFVASDAAFSVFSAAAEQIAITTSFDASTPPSSDAMKGAGVKMGWDANAASWMLDAVWYDSPAETAGLLPGDKLVSINGVIYPEPTGDLATDLATLTAKNEEVGRARTNGQDAFEVDRGGILTEINAGVDDRAGLWRRSIVAFIAQVEIPDGPIDPRKNSACFEPCPKDCNMNAMQGKLFCFQGHLEGDLHLEDQTSGEPTESACSGTCNEPAV